MADRIQSPLEFSAVRGLNGYTPSPPRDAESLTTRLKDEYWGWGLVNKVASTFYFLLPVIFLGRLGQMVGNRIFKRLPFLGVVGDRIREPLFPLVRQFLHDGGDELFSCFWTGSFRVFQSGEDSDAYLKDMGQGLVARGLMQQVLSGAVQNSLFIRFALIPIAMTFAGWLGEIAVEEKPKLRDLYTEGAGSEFLYRSASACFMVIVQSNFLLRGLPRFFGLSSLHADDWQWLKAKDERETSAFAKLEIRIKGQEPHTFHLDPETSKDPKKAVDQWFHLVGQADRYEALSLELPNGVRFSLTEVEGGNGKRGTVVDFRSMKGFSIESVLPFLTAIADAQEPRWRTISFRNFQADHPIESTRFLIPDGINRPIRLWGYRKYRNEYQPAIAGIAVRLREINQNLREGKGLTEEESDFLQGCRERRLREEALFRDQSGVGLIGWLVGKSIGLSGHEKNSLRRVFHNVGRRVQIWMFLEYNVLSDLVEEKAVPEIFIENAASQAELSVAKAIGEGVDLASGEFPDVHAPINDPDGILHSFRLSQGFMSLNDIFANFATNSWRYRSGEKSPKAIIVPKRLADGSIEMTYTDDGMGMDREFVLHRLGKMGEEGREKRRELAVSHGFGIASVIEDLRQLGWGLLWVRSEVGKGTSWRFVIPPQAVQQIPGKELPLLPTETFDLHERYREEGFAAVGRRL